MQGDDEHQGDDDTEPLTPEATGLSRSLTGISRRRSSLWECRVVQIPKLTVQIRFPSPALMVKDQVRGPAILA